LSADDAAESVLLGYVPREIAAAVAELAHHQEIDNLLASLQENNNSST
jgi:hypothetical protein